MSEKNSNWDKTEQITLSGDVQTRLVNKEWTDRYTIDISRSESGDNHMNNTPIGESGWLGNPYKVSEYGRNQCIRLFRKDFEERIDSDADFREAVENLQGETLACYCKPKPCHGDVIIEYVTSSCTSKNKG